MMSKYIKIEDLHLHLQNLVLDGERLDPKTTRLIIMTLRELPIHEFDDECENGQTTVRINLNEIVKFKLSERGKEVYRHRYDGYGFEYDREPKLDDDGYMSMQLWTFMEIFGKHMTLGMPEVVKPLEIIYESENEAIIDNGQDYGYWTVVDRARMKLGDKVTIPAIVEEIEHTILGGINYKVEPLNTWFDADEIEALGQTESGTFRTSEDREEWYGEYHTCNECGATWMGDINFCPNCGTSMRPITHRQNNDTISRQMAIKTFCEDCRGLKPGQCEYWDRCKSLKVLRSLPPSERESGWIPVSERLPEPESDYQVLVNVIAPDKAYDIIITDSWEVVEYVQKGWINAWQPLPEPYKGGDDNE